MKKSLSLLAAFLVAGMWSAPVQAADHYVSGMAGISWFQDAEIQRVYHEEGDYDNYKEEMGFDSGLTLAGAIGCDYGSTRLEAEIGYQKNDVDGFTSSWDGNGESEYAVENGKATVLSLMANGYYDIDLGGVELYAMAGVGVAQVNLQWDDYENVPYDGRSDFDTNYEVNEVAFAYQLGAGLAIPVSDGVMIDARYRYFATTDFSFGDDRDELGNYYPDQSYNMNLSSHSALLGLRVNL